MGREATRFDPHGDFAETMAHEGAKTPIFLAIRAGGGPMNWARTRVDSTSF